MVGKNNYKTRAEKAANKKQRFSLKKLSVGVASVAVGSTLLLGNAETVSADEYEPTTEELQEALQTEKESAKAELQEAGATSPRLAQAIDAADSVEEVEQLKNDFLDVRRQQVEQDQAAEDQTDEVDEELEAAKEAAIAEVQAAGFTDEKYAGWINAQETEQDVNGIKRDILTTVPNEEQSSIEGETSVDTENNTAPEIDWSGAEAAYELEQEQESAIAELQGIGIENDTLFGLIRDADSVEEVKRVKSDIIDVRQQQVSELPDQATTNEEVYEDVSPSTSTEEFTDEEDENDFDIPDYGSVDNKTIVGVNVKQQEEGLRNAKAEAIAEIQAAGYTEQEYADVINAQSTVRFVEDAKNEILATDPAEEEAQEEVYTLYYYGQRTQNQNGATTVKATSPREALEYFQNFLSENGLDAGDFNWHYESEDRVFTASEKIEGEASVDSEYDFLAPEFDWSGLEEAIKGEKDQKEVYSFVYITQNTKGQNGATTVKASSLEEAKEYFQNWAEEHDLGDLEWSYDEETKTFTAHEKTEEDTGIKGSTTVESVYDFLPDSELTWDELVDELSNGSDDSKDQKTGQDVPVKSVEGSEDQVATPVQDSKQATGQTGSQATGQGQAPTGQAQTSNQQAAEESGQTLPDTATSTWALGLLGLSSLAGGLFAGKNKED
ncbi:Immunoglobulin G-binding protein G precursor [Alloiococcus otitis]|uniref:YSIRK family Gram-positive signal peptide n=1 Tax=Alloiococcus otitis ATCC 51267 TaxID=883081 RepID=K9E8I0_9LACT|nr:albumin-binding GA domain-containing protein [Alloiococcus otitis]EKU93494.1 YSIRK family Gram-positive signal peptide [Alloiococcus otitis ATCC 51267]SUU81495.1 Immunoglobulin G-binding protein G precursor [Alloiococcus otitis]